MQSPITPSLHIRICSEDGVQQEVREGTGHRDHELSGILSAFAHNINYGVGDEQKAIVSHLPLLEKFSDTLLRQ